MTTTILSTDTDSSMYEIKTEDIYEDYEIIQSSQNAIMIQTT